MKIVNPNEITLVSSSLAEPGTDEGGVWDSGTTYAKGDKAVYAHVVYESLGASNTGNQPDQTSSGTDAKWKKLSPTNQWAMFDTVISTQSVSTAGTLEVVVSAAYVDTIALLNIKGSEVLVELQDTGDEAPYWSASESLVEEVDNEFDYEFAPIKTKRDVFFMDLPVCIEGTVRVVVSLAEGGAAIGKMIIGKAEGAGATLYGVGAGGRNLSNVEDDGFGAFNLVKKSSAKRIEGEVHLHPREFDSIKNLFDDIEAELVLFIGDPRPSPEGGLQALTAFGILKDYDLVVDELNKATGTISIKGVA